MADIRATERLPEEWQDTLRGWGEPAFRASQIFRWIHQRGVYDPNAMSDCSKSLRQRLTDDGVAPVLQLVHAQTSTDGTRKLLVSLADQSTVETVLIPQSGTQREVPLYTQCVSTQVGCAMGCIFCASGMAGLKRHLRADEIVAQVALSRSVLGTEGRVASLVLMGMGEPLHNYDATARALRLWRHSDGVGFSLRRITLSTSGLVPQIERLQNDFEGQVPLAISLHGATDTVREHLMPINRKYPLKVLMEALRKYSAVSRSAPTLEYTLIKGVNDAASEASSLVKLVRGLEVKVNLIPMNPVEGSPLQPSPLSAVTAFQQRLRDAGILTFVRKRMGDDITAACGQLALAGDQVKNRRHLRMHSQSATDA